MTGGLLMHPGLLLIAGGLLLPLLPPVLRAVSTLLVPLSALLIAWQLPEGALWHASLLEYAITPLRVDRLARLFAIVFALMAFAGGLYALNQPSRSEVPAAFVYAGSAVGAALAGDLLTLFAFWETMALASTLVVWSARTRESGRAGMRYLAIHLLGGVLLMAGIAGHVADTGSVAFEHMAVDSLAHWLILSGFLLNAAAPPLSAWLADAYPSASWSGMVFLSAFTTKTAVYVLLRGFAGTELLVYLGVFMIFYGIVYALLENDMRRILAYSIVNQVGFMVAGAGIGTQLAINGAAAHAFAHIIYKALLLMSAGSVLLMTGRSKCSELGGLFRSMPLTTACGIVGALAISAFPLTSGFISKSMISQAAADGHVLWLWLMLAAASAGVFLHAGIKFPWFVFFQKDSGLRPPDPPLNMRLAMLLFAFLCVALGIYPAPLFALLPYPVNYVPYTASHVLAQLQLLLFSGLAFFVMLPWLKRTPTITLDVDWLYRIAGARLSRAAIDVAGDAYRRLERWIERWAETALARVYRHHGPNGVLSRTWPTGSMVLWVAILLASYLVLYYF
jgi:multicomponent Na+:H+ antiporter subunit D